MTSGCLIIFIVVLCQRNDKVQSLTFTNLPSFIVGGKNDTGEGSVVSEAWGPWPRAMMLVTGQKHAAQAIH